MSRDVLCPVAIDDAWKSCHWAGPLRKQIEKDHIVDLSDPTEKQFAKVIEGLGLFYR